MRHQHPVFVYGTLRPGQGNYQRLLSGRSVRESPAIVKGLALYGAGFPYAVPQPGARIVGELITINPDQYSEVLDDLDALEGYRAGQQSRSHYIRVTRSVIAHRALPGGGTWEASHTAWIYLAGPGVRAATLPRITDDDWLAHVSAYR